MMDSRASSSPARLRYFDSILGSLCRAGFPLAEAARAFSLLDSYVYGFARQRLNIASGEEADDASLAAEAFGEGLPEEGYPYLAQMTELAIREGYDEEADFEFGLGLILEGLARRLG